MRTTTRTVASMVLLGLISAGCSGDSTTPMDADPTATPASTLATIPSVTQPTPTESRPSTEPSSSVEPTGADTTAPAREVIPIIDEADAVLAVIRSRDDLRRFAALVDAVGADRVFLQERGVTILAPNDDAWDAFGDEAWQALLADPDAAALEVARYLSVGSFSLAALLEVGTFANAMSESVVVADGDPPTIGGAPVVAGDLAADNGYVHVLGALLGT